MRRETSGRRKRGSGTRPGPGPAVRSRSLPIGPAAALVLLPVVAGIIILVLAGLLPLPGALGFEGEVAGRSYAGVNPGDLRPTPTPPAIALNDRIVREGLEVGFAAGPAEGEPGIGTVLAGGSADLWFSLADVSTGERRRPGQPPAVWVDLEKAGPRESGGPLACEDKVRLYTRGSLGFRPDIDLNSYLILALNGDASISVIDPLVGMAGMTQLRAMVLLKSPGEDWALSPDQKTLFVSMPGAGQVAVVDTESFKVRANVDTGGRPVRLALEPGGGRLWVSDDSPEERRSGVAVVDTATLDVLARIPTGAGPHELAFSGARVFVTNRAAGTLSAIDALGLEKVKDVGVGARPGGLSYSSASGAVYVAGEAEGTISVVDGSRLDIVRRLKVSAGVTALRFSPDGRWGFAVSPKAGTVAVFDALTNRLAHTLKVEGEPDQVAFTHGYAYLRSAGSARVTLVDLALLEGPEAAPVVGIAVGQNPPGSAGPPSPADAVFSIHEHGNHVLVANPADRYIYYYMEGMNAPMGGFQNYSRVPRAVRVVDRGIREVSSGVYTARIPVPRSGRYQVAFLLDSPRIVHCFGFTAEANPSAPAAEEATAPTIELLTEERQRKTGEEFSLRFRLVDPRGSQPLSGIQDVELLVTHASGLWRERYRATAAEEGIYEVRLALPRPGAYNLLFAVPSLKIAYGRSPSAVLQAVGDR